MTATPYVALPWTLTEAWYGGMPNEAHGRTRSRSLGLDPQPTPHPGAQCLRRIRQNRPACDLVH